MLASKSLSLVEQKKLQWAREREEMLGLYGLWGKPKNEFVEKTSTNSTTFYTRNNLLPPILAKNEESVEEFRPEDESETSGYLSDSPKRIKQMQESPEEYECRFKESDHLSNEEVFEENQKNYWSESDKTDNYWADRKIYKNYKNENWIQEPQTLRQAHQSHHFQQPPMDYPGRECNYTRMFHNDRNHWHQTPESGSSDDGNRLRWGDRGVGIGHLWDPVINSPECRLPQVHNQFRQTPKWVEKGLKNYDGTKSEVLIINHPDDEAPDYKNQRNFILGQNAPIAPEVIEEREKKRKKAVEHQNAIKKQLEERAFKRQQEKERRLEEERQEEERIKKEQEIERIRYEEEQRKIREKEEMEKKREEAMKEAIEIAEKRAREEKKKNKTKRQVMEDEPRYGPSSKEKFGKLEKIQPTEVSLTQRKQNKKYKKQEENESKIQQPKEEETKKILKDSSSQFEEIQLANSFQVLNMNGLPVEGGLALMLDNSSNDSSFLLPPDGVQLALLMSPRNTSATNRLLPLSPSVSESIYSGERTLTPSKFRINNSRFHYVVPSNKSTQTDFRHSMGWTNPGSAGKRRRSSLRCGSKTGCNTTNLKSGIGEKVHKHGRFCMGNKYRSKPSKLEDRPKWGINRPSVQYKKQSEKDPYYQKRLREKLRNNMAEAATSSDQTIKNEEEDETTEEKELDSVVRMLELREEERGKLLKNKPEIVLQNGFRMNSNLSSPVFVPIDNRIKSGGSKSKITDVESEDSPTYPKEDHEEDESETEEEKTVKSGSGKFLNSIQLEAIEKISNLRECLWNLQKEYSNSRSTTPFSEKSTDK